jgi:hypothetical protein
MWEDEPFPNGTGPGGGSGSNHGSRMTVLSTGNFENPSKGGEERIESWSTCEKREIYQGLNANTKVQPPNE